MLLNHGTSYYYYYVLKLSYSFIICCTNLLVIKITKKCTSIPITDQIKSIRMLQTQCPSTQYKKEMFSIGSQHLVFSSTDAQLYYNYTNKTFHLKSS